MNGTLVLVFVSRHLLLLQYSRARVQCRCDDDTDDDDDSIFWNFRDTQILFGWTARTTYSSVQRSYIFILSFCKNTGKCCQCGVPAGVRNIFHSQTLQPTRGGRSGSVAGNGSFSALKLLVIGFGGPS